MSAPPRGLTPDIAWTSDVAAAFARAAALRRPVVLKPLGQGMGRAGDW